MFVFEAHFDEKYFEIILTRGMLQLELRKQMAARSSLEGRSSWLNDNAVSGKSQSMSRFSE